MLPWPLRAAPAAVTDNPVRTLGLGVAVLNVSLVPLVAASPQHSTRLLLAVQGMGALTALLFFFGSSTPRALRARWRRTELLALRVGEADLMEAETAAAVARIVLPQATRLVAARGAVLLDATGEIVATHAVEAEGARPALPPLPLPTGPVTTPRSTATTLAVPLHHGWLVLFTGAGDTEVGPDELAILESLGHLAGLAIDRAELFQHDRLARAALAERELELAEAQRTAQVGSYTWDFATSEVTWSEEMRHLLGLATGDTVDGGPAFLSCVHPEDAAVAREAWEQAKDAVDPISVEYRIVRPDGAVRWIQGRARPLPSTGGEPRRLLGTIQDITERRAVEAALAHQALHDPLTGLPNRQAFRTRLTEVMHHPDRSCGLAVFFLDIDRFKELNDSRGHAAGDELLVEVGRRLRAGIRPGDAVARFGGDEFVVLCEEVAGVLEAKQLANRLATVLRQSVLVAGEAMAITVSIGIAYLAAGEAPLTGEALVGHADAAMYQAKEGGRNRCAVVDASTQEKVAVRSTP